MLMFGCVDNIYVTHEGPVTLKKDFRHLCFVKNCAAPLATVATPTPELTSAQKAVPVQE